MPEDQRAESTIIHPAPATYSAIDQILTALGDVVERTAQIFGSSPGIDYMGGLQGGLAIALDHPEIVRDLLTTIDENKRQNAIADGHPDPAQAVQEDAEARVQFLKPLVDAALGKTLPVLPPPPSGLNFEWN